MINDPCYKCDDRSIGCHSQCEKYIKWAGDKRELNKIITRERNIDALVIGHVVSSIRRNKKQSNR